MMRAASRGRNAAWAVGLLVATTLGFGVWTACNPLPSQDLLAADAPGARPPAPAAAGSVGCLSCHSKIADPLFDLGRQADLIQSRARLQRRLTEVETEANVELRLPADVWHRLPADGKVVAVNEPRLMNVARDAALKAVAAEIADLKAGLASRTDEIAKNPALKAHPHFDEVFAAHPLNKVACTTCHKGDGAATDFTLAGHTPVGGQGEQWAGKHGWKPLAEGKGVAPMWQKGRTEASCLQCHSQVTDLPAAAAPKLNLAHRLIRDNACYACHQIDGFERDAAGKPTRQVRPDFTDEAVQKRGPSLENLALKMGFDEVAKWVSAPHEIRPGTRMPRFFHLSGGGPEHNAADDKAVADIAQYLLEGQTPAAERKKPAEGWTPVPAPDIKALSRPAEKDETFAQAGKRLFVENGCLACHYYAGLPTLGKHADAMPYGPLLAGLQYKLKGAPDAKAWLYNWLRDPAKLSPATRMPNMRLTEQDALAITTFLLDPKASDHVNADGAAKFNAEPVANPFELVKVAAGPRDAAAGKRLIEKPNCAGCHDIKGVAAPSRFSALAATGDVNPAERPHQADKLPAGRRTTYDWIRQWVEAPHDYNKGGPADIAVRHRPCPTYTYSEAEADALTVYLLGLRRETPPAEQVAKLSDAKRIKLAGEAALERYNCLACHMTEPGKIVVRPMPLPGNKRPEWLKLPDHVTLRGAPVSDLDGLPLTPKMVAKAIAKDDLKELLTQIRVQLWQPAALDPHLQAEFGAGLTEAESKRLARVHAIAVPEETRKKYAALRAKHPALELEPTSAAVVIPRADILRYEPARGGHLIEAIYEYTADPQDRDDKAGELAEAMFGKDPKPEMVAMMRPLALRDFRPRQQLFREKYLLYKGPPPLWGEGAKVQPAWLAKFLAEPTRLRPMVLLNMPKYTYRPGDIETLVTYFAAKDGVALDETYRERKPGYLAERLGELYSEGFVADDMAYWTADGATKTFGEAGAKNKADRIRGWIHVGERSLFSEAAGNRCMNCHAFGDAPIAGTENLAAGVIPNVQAGPNLAGVAARLRPEYLWKWLPLPGHVLPGTPMPANWGDALTTKLDPIKARMLQPAAGKTIPDAERNRLQIAAVIDLLMNPDQTAMSAKGARHNAVWPQIVESHGLPPDKAAPKNAPGK